jgi:hypothetical protein
MGVWYRSAVAYKAHSGAGVRITMSVIATLEYVLNCIIFVLVTCIHVRIYRPDTRRPFTLSAPPVFYTDHGDQPANARAGILGNNI